MFEEVIGTHDVDNMCWVYHTEEKAKNTTSADRNRLITSGTHQKQAQNYTPVPAGRGCGLDHVGDADLRLRCGDLAGPAPLPRAPPPGRHRTVREAVSGAQ